MNRILPRIKRFIIKCIRKSYNTLFYYIKGPNNILVVNCSFLQWGEKIVNSNIGDDVNLILFKQLTGKTIMNLDEFFHKSSLVNIMGIGSIIDWKTNQNAIVWGSGVLLSDTKINSDRKPIKVLSVRGKLTQEYLLNQDIYCPNIYGDPALLLPLLYKPQISSSNKIGIIPHYVDLFDSRLHDFISQNENVILIDIRNYKNWTDIIDLICSCKCIISSSLHGLILSDAYGIPNIWVKFSDKIKGNDFKYYDYFSIVERYDVPICFDDVDIMVIHNVVSNYRPIHYNTKMIMQVFPFQLRKEYSYLREQDIDIYDINFKS